MMKQAKSVASGKTRLFYRDAADRFFTLARLKPKTKIGYTTSQRNWDPFIGGLYLDEITPTIIKAFITARKARVSDSTVRADLMYLSSLFTHAIEWEDGPEINPVLSVSKRKLKTSKKSQRWYRPEEVAHFIVCCKQPYQARIIDLAVETGMRPVEMRQLEWRHVDLPRRELHVVESKSGRPRVVPLSDLAVRTLSGTPRHPISPFVLWHDDGQPFTTFRNWWEEVREKSRIDGRFYDFRHTFASWFLQAGGDIKRLADIMGHTTTEITERYGHLRTEDLHHELAKVRAHGRAHKPLSET